MLLQYLVLIENFKESHREMKSRQEGGFGTLEIKKDIQLMQNEMEQIHRTIEKLKKKVAVCLYAIFAFIICLLSVDLKKSFDIMMTNTGCFVKCLSIALSANINNQ